MNNIIVTAYFDIGRGEIDGRDQYQYLKWLQRTCEFFPYIHIFTDKTTNLGIVPNTVTVHRLDFHELVLNQRIKEIEDICHIYISEGLSSDLTYKLPKYAVMQFGKFQLISILAKAYPSEFITWVDAGVSRFIEGFSIENVVTEIPSSSLLNEGIFEVDIRKNILLSGLRRSRVGTNKRVFSGTSFTIRATMAEEYFEKTNQLANAWLNQRKWDNEQVALNNLFLQKAITPTLIVQRGRTGSVARYILGTQSYWLISTRSLIYRFLQGVFRSSNRY